MQSLKCFIAIVLLVSSPIALKAETVLAQFMPYYFNEDLTYKETTQNDLLNTTNAFRIFSFDYVINDEVFASVHSSWTEGEMYNHHVNAYKRSEGFTLEEIESLTIEGYGFLLSEYSDNEDALSYVLAFSLEFVNGYLNLHSHWSPQQIQTIHDLYNYEITFSSREDAMFFIPLMLDKIQDIADLEQAQQELICPKIFIKDFKLVNGKMEFTFHNELGNDLLSLNTDIDDFKINIDNEVACEVSIDWNLTEAVLANLENNIDLQDDYLYINARSITTSVKETNALDFDLFPNPTVDFINVNAQGNIQLVDVNGKIIYTENNINGNTTIDVRGLPKNAYFLRLFKDSRIETKKVIVI